MNDEHTEFDYPFDAETENAKRVDLKYYFAIDDRLVNHHRRYDLEEIHKKLNAGGFTPTITWKILGPLEKITMMAVAGCYILTREIGKAWPGANTRRPAAAGLDCL